MTYNDDGWTDWIEHDGKGCPCVGMYCNVVFKFAGGNFDLSISGGHVLAADEWVGVTRGGASWDWCSGCTPIIRYRIRKPRGMAVLESILADMPETIHSKEDV